MICAVICVFLRRYIGVNYNMNDYLPSDSPSTVALEIMEQEFDGGIPNARVMIENVTLAEALEYKEKLKSVDGVSEVTWLDNAADISIPLEMQDERLIGEKGIMAGSAVSTAVAIESMVVEVAQRPMLTSILTPSNTPSDTTGTRTIHEPIAFSRSTIPTKTAREVNFNLTSRAFY